MAAVIETHNSLHSHECRDKTTHVGFQNLTYLLIQRAHVLFLPLMFSSAQWSMNSLFKITTSPVLATLSR